MRKIGMVFFFVWFGLSFFLWCVYTPIKLDSGFFHKDEATYQKYSIRVLEAEVSMITAGLAIAMLENLRKKER